MTLTAAALRMDIESNRPADDDRCGGMNTMTRRASGDLCTPGVRPIVCSACNGTGYSRYYEYRDCDVCDGRGTITSYDVELRP